MINLINQAPTISSAESTESKYTKDTLQSILFSQTVFGTFRVASYQNAIQGLGLKVELLLYFDISKVELGRYEIVKEQCTWNKSGTKHERENIAAS